MYYEVYIPSPDQDGFDVTITVDAENWMSALKSGLERTGEGADAVRNVMCDIKDDNSIHVTDATTQRVFVLEELGEEPPEGVDVGEPEKGAERPDTLKEEAVDPPSEPPEKPSEPPSEPPEEPPETPSQPAVDTEEVEVLEKEKEEPPETPESPEASQQATAPETPQVVQDDEGRHPSDEALAEDSFTRDEEEMEVGSQSQEALQDEKDEPRVVDEQRERSDVHRAAQVGRQEEEQKVSESLIEDVFLEIQPIHEGDKGMEEVVNFVMDLSMEKIDAESGSILFADTTGTELYFAAARGPKAKEVMDFRVPMGEGIVGFCSKEGVSLAVSDAQNDPRFYEEISESIGYETDSLLCAPIQYEGRVYGAIELINRVNGTTFTSDEMNALAYIGRQLAEYVNRVVMQRESLDD